MAALSLLLHNLAATLWVGGMFFAYVILRPSLAETAAAERLALWQRVFTRFFPWVLAAIAVLLATGYGLLFLVLGGFGGAGLHVHVMHLTGWLMFLLFFHLYFVPWRRYRRALADGNPGDAARWLGQIRLIVLVNLVLGLLTVAVGASGRAW
jgi:uncharacterized membrane protein